MNLGDQMKAFNTTNVGNTKKVSKGHTHKSKSSTIGNPTMNVGLAQQ